MKKFLSALVIVVGALYMSQSLAYDHKVTNMAGERIKLTITMGGANPETRLLDEGETDTFSGLCITDVEITMIKSGKHHRWTPVFEACEFKTHIFIYKDKLQYKDCDFGRCSFKTVNFK